MGMFDFLLHADDYEQRCIGRFDADWGFVSTARVYDADKPYETAVKHPDYNDGKIVIVEPYDTRGEAEKGHAKWVDTMTAEKLPDTLQDKSLAGLAVMLDVFANEDWRTKKRDEWPETVETAIDHS